MIKFNRDTVKFHNSKINVVSKGLFKNPRSEKPTPQQNSSSTLKIPKSNKLSRLLPSIDTTLDYQPFLPISPRNENNTTLEKFNSQYNEIQRQKQRSKILRTRNNSMIDNMKNQQPFLNVNSQPL